MGDGADMALDNAWDDWEQLQEYKEGNMSLDDAYDAGIIDEFGAEIGDSRLPTGTPKRGKSSSKYTKTGKRKASSYECQYCGKKNLKWVEENSKWRLHDRKGPHKCDAYKEKKNANG